VRADVDRDSSSPRVPLPEGTIPVGIGLFVSGITTYAFFKVGQLALGKDDFKPIVAMWFLTFALVPGVFLPVEQEIGRALAHRRALGQGGRPVVQRMLPLAALLAATVALPMALAGPLLTRELFEGYGLVAVALVLAFCAYGPMHLVRGIASGSGRFVAYGLILAVDGTARTAGCVALWLADVRTPGAYALVVAASPLVATLLVVGRGEARTMEGPPASWGELTPNLGWLLAGTVMSAALINAGPLGVDVLAAPGEAAKVTAFGNGLLLARVPLYLFQAVQAALLPRLARLAAQGNLAEFRRGLVTLMRIVTGVAVLGTLGAFLAGPAVLELVYEGGLDRRTLTLLALACALYMAALALAQAVIALNGHALVALGWTTAFATFFVVTWLSADDVFLRVELGLVAASVAALAVFAAAYRARIAAGAVPDAESLIDGIADAPLEG